MKNIYIDYGVLVDEAMHTIVKKSLDIFNQSKDKGEHHFFISFITYHQEVQLSEKLRKKYPKEMTIVIQYQYEDLNVKDDFISVVLSFDNVKEKIHIPFKAMTAFADPSVKFGLQFKQLIDDNVIIEHPFVKSDNLSAYEEAERAERAESSNVISFNKLRENKKK